MGSSALAFDAAWALGTVVLVLVLAAVVLALRRFLIERGGGTVECGLRKPGGVSADQPASHHGRWRLGVAAYQLDELRWYSAFGISARPAYTFGRRSLSVVSRRRPDPEEAVSLGPDRVIVQCRLSSDETFELALAESALTGLLAWLEAAPPGSHLGWASLTPSRSASAFARTAIRPAPCASRTSVAPAVPSGPSVVPAPRSSRASCLAPHLSRVSSPAPHLSRVSVPVESLRACRTSAPPVACPFRALCHSRAESWRSYREDFSRDVAITTGSGR